MKKWKKAEIEDTKLFHTILQRGSGRVDHYPGDSNSDFLNVETKYTEKDSYSISKKKWKKLEEETVLLNTKDNKLRIPILSLHLGGLHLMVLAFEDYDILHGLKS